MNKCPPIGKITIFIPHAYQLNYCRLLSFFCKKSMTVFAKTGVPHALLWLPGTTRKTAAGINCCKLSPVPLSASWLPQTTNTFFFTVAKLSLLVLGWCSCCQANVIGLKPLLAMYFLKSSKPFTVSFISAL